MTDKPKVSASQIKIARTCLRKWAFAYVAGEREPSGPAQILGTAVHAVLERYLRDGTQIDGTTPEGKIAQAGLPYLPAPGSGRVEDPFRIDVGDFVFHGFVDYRSDHLVIDHKTTSDFKWALTPEALATDPQGILYAAAQGGDNVPLSWVYYRTKGSPKARPVDTTLSRVQIEVGLGGLTDEAAILVRLRADSINPLSLPPTPSACFAYGKLCPHSQKCSLTTLERISRMQPIGKDALLAQLKSKALGATPPAAPSTPLPAAPAPAPAPEDPQIAALKAQLTALTAPAAPAPAPVPTLPFPPAALAPEDPQIAALKAQLAALKAPAAAPLPALVPPPEPAKRGPGRPPKNPAAGAAAPAAPAVAPVAPAPAAPAVAPAINGTPAIGTLYVDCLPVRGQAAAPPLATDLFSKAHEEIKAHGFVHYKHIEFGKGPSVFCACVADALRACPVPHLFVSSRTPEGSDVLETLISLSGNVVRGL